jgi:hypothetical protein
VLSGSLDAVSRARLLRGSLATTAIHDGPATVTLEGRDRAGNVARGNEPTRYVWSGIIDNTPPMLALKLTQVSGLTTTPLLPAGCPLLEKSCWTNQNVKVELDIIDANPDPSRSELYVNSASMTAPATVSTPGPYGLRPSLPM